jgi:hypothetical protein
MKSFLGLAVTSLVALVAVGCTVTTSGSSGGSSGGTQSPDRASPAGGGACYADTRTGCQDVAWSDVERLIDAAYLGRTTYFGHDKASAKSTAKTIYENGTLPGARLSLFRARSTDGKTSRVIASVLDANGHPARGLTASAFAVGGGEFEPSRVIRLGDATRDDVRLRLSAVLDDSGSISDCDAQFVADGVAHLFETVPPVYSAELVKFATHPMIVAPFTEDGAALAAAARSTCTDRGATSLWDGAITGIESLERTVTEDETPMMVIFSDGFDNDSERSFRDVAEAAARSRIPTLVVGIGIADPFALTELARVTGGGFVYVPSGQRALEAFKTVTTMMTDSYVVDLPADAAFLAVALPDGTSLRADVP